MTFFGSAKQSNTNRGDAAELDPLHNFLGPSRHEVQPWQRVCHNDIRNTGTVREHRWQVHQVQVPLGAWGIRHALAVAAHRAAEDTAGAMRLVAAVGPAYQAGMEGSLLAVGADAIVADARVSDSHRRSGICGRGLSDGNRGNSGSYSSRKRSGCLGGGTGPWCCRAQVCDVVRFLFGCSFVGG